MIDYKELEERMRRAKPTLKIEPAFTARVMEQVHDAHLQPNFTLWRTWAMAAAVLAVVVVGGALAVTHRPVSQAVAKQTSQKTQTTSQMGQAGNSKNAAYYRQLASSAQGDVNSISQQTASFSDNDYGDNQLADSAIF